MTDIALVVFDMAGTTVRDDGLVERAFVRAAAQAGLNDPAALDHVRATMGQSKIEVFGQLTGDEAAARELNEAFERAVADLVAAEGVTEIEGAREVFERLRGAGVRTALTTGFSPRTRDTILDALGWRDAVDVALAPADAGRGRPYPDLPLTALLRTGARSVGQMAVVGDTVSDMASGRAAGAGWVIGVESGADSAAELRTAGADAIMPTVREVPALLGIG